jgi:hypothetical protein
LYDMQRCIGKMDARATRHDMSLAELTEPGPFNLLLNGKATFVKQVVATVAER